MLSTNDPRFDRFSLSRGRSSLLARGLPHRKMLRLGDPESGEGELSLWGTSSPGEGGVWPMVTECRADRGSSAELSATAERSMRTLGVDLYLAVRGDLRPSMMAACISQTP